MTALEKIRVWQVNFAIRRPLPDVPLPLLLVEEVQSHAGYRIGSRDIPGGQLSITIGGTGGLRIGDREIRLRPGMAFLHNHNDPAITYFFPPGASEPWRFLWIAFAGAESLTAEVNARYGYCFHLSLERDIVPQLSALRPQSSRIGVEPLTALGGGRLIYELLERLGDTVDRPLLDHPAGRLATRAQELVLAHLDRELPGADLAKNLSLSREHLLRVFREQTGETLHAYQLNCRLELALRLLAQQQLSCKEVALRCGFRHYSSFARAVRRRTGRTPEELRTSPPMLLHHFS